MVHLVVAGKFERFALSCDLLSVNLIDGQPAGVLAAEDVVSPDVHSLVSLLVGALKLEQMVAPESVLGKVHGSSGVGVLPGSGRLRHQRGRNQQ